MLIIPERPWTIWSYAGRWLMGPVWPNPEIAQYTSPGCRSLQVLPRISESCHHPGSEVLQEHVGLAQKALERRPVLRCLEVDLDGTLAGVLGQEGRADLPGVEVRVRAELAREVTPRGSLDLHDLGTEQAAAGSCRTVRPGRW